MVIKTKPVKNINYTSICEGIYKLCENIKFMTFLRERHEKAGSSGNIGRS
jgi:hypothetical protein